MNRLNIYKNHLRPYLSSNIKTNTLLENITPNLLGDINYIWKKDNNNRST